MELVIKTAVEGLTGIVERERVDGLDRAVLLVVEFDRFVAGGVVELLICPRSLR